MNTAPSPSPGLLERRLLPAVNPNSDDRRTAWDELLAAGTYEQLLRYISRHNFTLVNDEDVMQEVLILAFTKVEKGEYESREVGIMAWLYSIARHKIFEAARWRGFSSLDDLEEVLPDLRNERVSMEYQTTRVVLQDAIAALPDRCRLVVQMSFSGFTSDEIAQRLNIRADLVRKDKSLALRRMRDRLAEAFPERIRRAA